VASAYTSQYVLKNSTTQDVAENATKQVVSAVFPISAHDSMAFRADLTAASTTGGTPTVMLQTSHDQSTWVDGKAVNVADGNVAVNYLPTVAGDQAYMPLRCWGRFAVTTGAGVSVSITKILVATSR
jgi:hypothetical protein